MQLSPYSKLVGSSSLIGLLAASSADAVIITNTDLDLGGFTVSDTNSLFNWNIDGDVDGIAELRVRTDSTGDYLDLMNFQNDFQVGVKEGGLLNVSVGNLVGNIVLFSTKTIYSVLESGNLQNAYGFTSGESGYIGFQFNPNGTNLYGWAEIVLTEDSEGSGSFEVVQWAFDDSGAGILVGATLAAVPEPATSAAALGLLALGVVGVRRWRRSKR